MPVRPLLLALGTVLCVTVAVLHGQTKSQTSQSGAASRLDTLPPALREQGQAILSQRDDRQRAELVAALARNSPDAAREFLLAVLASEPSPEVRSAIVNRLGRSSSRAVREVLAERAASDADPGVALQALERLRVAYARDLAALLERRMDQARAARDEAALRRLAPEHERWISLVRGTMLPSFLRVPPPVFPLKPEDQPIRVLAFGDFGTGSKEQKQVAAAMLAFHRQTA